MLYSIIKNIEQNLFDQNRIKLDRGQIGRHLHVKGSRPGIFADMLHRTTDNLGQIRPFLSRLQGTIAKPCHIQKVLNKPVQAFAFLKDGLGKLPAILFSHAVAIA